MRLKVCSIIIFLLVSLLIIFLIYTKIYNGKNIVINNDNRIYETICGKYNKGEMKIHSESIFVDIADNNCKRELGLSRKNTLGEDEGMFFTFEKTGNYEFWMKDMNFPIDVLWVDEDFNIVGIENSLATSTYPNIFGGNYFSKYVLELSAGNSQKNKIKVGDKIVFLKK